MRFSQCKIEGAWLLRLERHEDERGYFARTWCRQEFAEHGLNTDLVQCNLSYNRLKGTLRGMHSQLAPCEEAKLVRCTRGALWDVMLDLRPGSPTFLRYEAITLTDDNDRMVYVPEGVFHGFLTLEDNTDAAYQMSALHAPECAIGWRYDDPAFDIDWPIPIQVVSARDMQWPDYAVPAEALAERASAAGPDARFESSLVSEELAPVAINECGPK